MADQTMASPGAASPARVFTKGPLGWIRANLFNTWFNSLLTILILWMLWELVPGIVNWLVLDAVWGAQPASVCREATGACWAFLHEKWRFIIFGRYTFDEQWRPAIAMAILITLLVVSCNRKYWRKELAYAWVGVWVVFFTLMHGDVLFVIPTGMSVVPTTQWGGLPLTLVLATIGITVAFPMGILLALGRRSKMPGIRILCIAYIELIRGVPLITVLFMASVMFPLFLPTGITIDGLLRAQIGIILFAAAYLAEVVRGGLQALPKGQYEAADSLGLTYWQSMRQIILPQALRISIPPLVNTFIGLFKDTSLVAIIGLFDLLGAAKAAFTDAEWLGFYREPYLFVSVIYWIFCYSMSKYSQHLEAKLNAGTRR